MSASELSTAPDETGVVVDPRRLSDDQVRELFTLVVKEYVDRQSTRRFAPMDRDRVTATEGVVAVSAMLDTLNIEVFELGMWKSWGVV